MVPSCWGIESKVRPRYTSAIWLWWWASIPHWRTFSLFPLPYNQIQRSARLMLRQNGKITTALSAPQDTHTSSVLTLPLRASLPLVVGQKRVSPE